VSAPEGPNPTGRPLKHRAARGGAAAFGAQMFRLAVRTGTMAVLARLLTPADFGLVAVAIACGEITIALVDIGLSQAALREKHLPAQQSSNLFWVNFSLGLVLAAVLALSANGIAAFYGKPEVAPLIWPVALAVVIASLGVQQHTLLQRDLRFGDLAREDVIQVTVSSAMSIVLATLGYGVWSLLWGNVLGRAAGVAFAWTRTRWIPSLPRRGQGTRRLLRTGAGLAYMRFIFQLRISADAAVLGRFATPDMIGLYNRAYGLLLLPIQQVQGPFTKVAVPLLTRLRHEPERFARAYRQLVALLGIATNPLVAILFFTGADVVRIVLGPAFAGSVPLFRVMAIAAVGMPVAGTVGWVVLACGKVREQALRATFSTTLMISAYVVGAMLGGAMGLAIAYAIAVHLNRVTFVYFGLRNTPVRYSEFFAGAVPSTVAMLVASAAMAVPEFVLPWLGHELPRPWASLAVTASTGAISYGAVILAWPRLRRQAREALELVRSLRGRAPAPRMADPPVA